MHFASISSGPHSPFSNRLLRFLLCRNLTCEIPHRNNPTTTSNLMKLAEHAQTPAPDPCPPTSGANFRLQTCVDSLIMYSSLVPANYTNFSSRPASLQRSRTHPAPPPAPPLLTSNQAHLNENNKYLLHLPHSYRRNFSLILYQLSLAPASGPQSYGIFFFPTTSTIHS